MIDAVAPELPDLLILVAGERARSSSTIAASGAYVVVVTSTVSALALTLTSVYLAPIAAAGDTSASHLRLAPRCEPQLAHCVLSGQQAGSTHARTCMLDHAMQLREALAQLTGQQVAIDVEPAALEHAAAVWQDAG